jgi:hypothetical protein
MQPSAARLSPCVSRTLQVMPGTRLLINSVEINTKYLNPFSLFFLTRAIYRFLDCITCNNSSGSAFSLASEPCIRVATRLASPLIIRCGVICLVDIGVGHILNPRPLPWPFASV